jgi:ATP-dependent exoDNAse (exonuclease V) alpha subunit
MDYADRAGALVVPTGDAHQLGPVEAGGMFPALIAELGAAELSEVMRFDAPWERDASIRLRAGDFSVVASYDRRGRIRGGTARRHTTVPRVHGWPITCTGGR